MSRLLLDTHAWVWFLSDNPNLPSRIRQRLIIAQEVAASAVSVYEIGQKLRRGTWPGMTADLLDAMVQAPGIAMIGLDPAMARLASLMDWDHRDPFDRMLAATAEIGGYDLVSRDAAFDTLPNRPRIWA